MVVHQSSDPHLFLFGKPQACQDLPGNIATFCRVTIEMGSSFRGKDLCLWFACVMQKESPTQGRLGSGVIDGVESVLPNVITVIGRFLGAAFHRSQFWQNGKKHGSVAL